MLKEFCISCQLAHSFHVNEAHGAGSYRGAALLYLRNGFEGRCLAQLLSSFCHRLCRLLCCFGSFFHTFLYLSANITLTYFIQTLRQSKTGKKTSLKGKSYSELRDHSQPCSYPTALPLTASAATTAMCLARREKPKAGGAKSISVKSIPPPKRPPRAALTTLQPKNHPEAAS